VAGKNLALNDLSMEFCVFSLVNDAHCALDPPLNPHANNAFNGVAGVCK
jgi:hypothetical protein